MRNFTSSTRTLIALLLITIAFILLPLVTSAMLQVRVINVAAGGDIQTAINQCLPETAGCRIILQANDDYNAPSEGLILPVKSGDAYISIESSRYSEIPVRAFYSLRPTAAELAMMPRIRSSHPSEPVIKAAPGAHHYKLLGLDLAPRTGGQASKVIEFGTSGATQDTIAEVPYNLIVDKSYIHADPTQDIQRCVALNSGYTEITNSWIAECHYIGIDSQAIAGWNGPGPYKIINDLLEGAGENVLFGGADPSIPGLIPSDIEIRRSYFYKPMSWKVGHPSYAGIHWTVKNLFEPKAGRRITVDGCVFDGTWVDAQTGWAILIKVQNQDGGCKWCVTEDVTLSNNIIKNSTNGLNVSAYDPYLGSEQLKRLKVINNLWLVDDAWFQGTGGGKLPDGTPAPDGADGVLLEHNTHLQKNGNTMTLYGGPTRNFVYKNNLGARTGYGIKGDGLSEGNPTFSKFTPEAVIMGNVLVGAPIEQYPVGNYYPVTWEEIKLGSDYRLAATSPFKGKGTDGRDPGVDVDALLAAQGSKGPLPSPSPSLPPPSPTATPTPIASPSPTSTPTPQPTPTGTPLPTPTPMLREYKIYDWPDMGHENWWAEITRMGWKCVPYTRNGKTIKAFCQRP